MITTSDPILQDGRIVPGTPARFLAMTAEPLPEGTVVTLRITAVGGRAETDSDVVTIAMTVDATRTLLSATLTVAQVASILGATYTPMYSWARYRVTTGADDTLLPLFAGRLRVESRWTGVTGVALTAGASEAQAAIVAANAAQAAQAAVEGALATVVSLVPDPDNPGLYLIASGLTADPDNDGLYLIGALA